MSRFILIALILTGCTREIVRYETVPLPIPRQADLPTVYGSELQCLSDDVYNRMFLRQTLLDRDLDVCRSLICSTHPEGECPEEE